MPCKEGEFVPGLRLSQGRLLERKRL